MGVRGTDFGVTVTPSGVTNLDVISGAVSMAPISQGEFTNTNNDFLENIVSSEKSVMVTKEQTTRVDPNSNTVPSPQKIPKTKLNKLKASDIPITSQSTSNEENNKDKNEERKQERKKIQNRKRKVQNRKSKKKEETLKLKRKVQNRKSKKKEKTLKLKSKIQNRKSKKKEKTIKLKREVSGKKLTKRNKTKNK